MLLNCDVAHNHYLIVEHINIIVTQRDVVKYIQSSHLEGTDIFAVLISKLTTASAALEGKLSYVSTSLQVQYMPLHVVTIFPSQSYIAFSHNIYSDQMF